MRVPTALEPSAQRAPRVDVPWINEPCRRHTIHVANTVNGYGRYVPKLQR